MKKQLSLRLNEAEYNILCKKAAAVGLKKEPFLRSLLMGRTASMERKERLIGLVSQALNCTDSDKVKSILLEIMIVTKGL